MLYFLMFFYIFGFKIYYIIDSTLLVGFFLTIKMLFNKKYYEIFKKNINNKKTYIIILTYIFLIAVSLFACLLGQMFDLSYTKTLIHLGIIIVIGYQLYSYFQYKGENQNILKYIVVAFLMQTVFQWVCYIFPTFSSYFNYFRSSAMIEKSIHYDGYRGIALSQSGFFALSASYALVILLYFSKNNTLFAQKPFLKYLFFGLLVSGAFFAGRTGFIGLLLIPVLLIAENKNNLVIKVSTIKKGVITVLCIILFFTFVNYMSNSQKLAGLYKFTFELFNNYERGLGFRSTSTDQLLNMYNLEIKPKTFILGDGMYSSEDGRYYMKTDVGYLRKIFYFGIFGLLLSIIFQIAIIKNGKITRENLLILLLLLILELKGEIIGLNIMINSILILYSHKKIENEKSNYINDNI